MIEHIVLFRCKSGVTGEIRQGIVEAARALAPQIPEILSMSAGLNFSERADGTELAMVMRFASESTLGVYQVHPAHQAFVAEWIRPNVEKVIAVDYTTPV